jgi:hypothetical protein
MDIVNGFKYTDICQCNVIHISSLSWSPLLPFDSVYPVPLTRVYSGGRTTPYVPGDRSKEL